jgi:hypothetical protein
LAMAHAVLRIILHSRLSGPEPISRAWR